MLLPSTLQLRVSSLTVGSDCKSDPEVMALFWAGVIKGLHGGFVLGITNVRLGLFQRNSHMRCSCPSPWGRIAIGSQVFVLKEFTHASQFRPRGKESDPE